jgi:predicted HAD superfamily Cof-like phosphohydrolase
MIEKPTEPFTEEEIESGVALQTLIAEDVASYHERCDQLDIETSASGTAYTREGRMSLLEGIAREVSGSAGRNLVPVCGVPSEPFSLQSYPADKLIGCWPTHKPSHEDRVRQMMKGFGQECPPSPTVSDYKTRELRVRLLLEEVLEYADAAAVQVFISTGHDTGRVDFDDLFFHPAMRLAESAKPDLVAMLDAVADISVVAVGTSVAHGFPLAEAQSVVDENNLLKIKNGSVDEHGKFKKHPDHLKPDFAAVLIRNGWKPDGES